VGLGIKHYERNRLHTTILGAVRDEITRLDQDSEAIPESTGQIRGAAETKHNKEFAFKAGLDRKKRSKSVWPRIPLHLLWLGLPLAIGVVGVLVLVLSVVGVEVE
jgi:hypothetical protein